MLVADDESLVRSFIKQLADEDASVSSLFQAADGLEAVEAARAHQPDLIFLDIRMPGLNGLEAADRIRICAPCARIVILTAYDDFEYARKALRLGALDYLLKPVRPAHLLEHIHAAHMAKNTVAAAEKAERPSAEEAALSWPAAVKAAAAYAAGHLGEKLTLAVLAKAAHASPYHLSHLFTRHTGKPLMDFVLRLRIAKAKELLADRSLSITQVADGAGFASSAYFSECFRKLIGSSPSAYRKKLFP
jgi:two-component system response regulator YesN